MEEEDGWIVTLSKGGDLYARLEFSCPYVLRVSDILTMTEGFHAETATRAMATRICQHLRQRDDMRRNYLMRIVRFETNVADADADALRQMCQDILDHTYRS